MNMYCCGSASGYSGKYSPTGMMFPYRSALSGIYSGTGVRLDRGVYLKGKLVAFPAFRENPRAKDDCYCRAVL